jgi:hypothetical protein
MAALYPDLYQRLCTMELLFAEADTRNRNVTEQFPALVQQYYELLSSQHSFYKSAKEVNKFLLNAAQEHYQPIDSQR